MHLKIFGIVIERKTDILAFAAFIISIGGLIAQAVNLVKGPDVSLEAPKQVLIKSFKYPSGKVYASMIAGFIYINKGSPGYDDITKSEEIFFLLDGEKITLSAQEYIATEYLDEEERFSIKKLSDANPVQIKSGSVEVHETRFLPWPSKGKNSLSNYVLFSTFLKVLETQPELTINIKATTYEGSIFKTSCKLQTKEFLHHLKEKEWSAPVCK